jgi:xylan 1,4-beta-xylosidase
MNFFARSSVLLMSFCLAITVTARSQEPISAQSKTAPKNLTEKIEVNALDRESPLPHFWEQMFGSGQAILAMRESYRKDLRMTKEITELRFVRFHDIFGDQVGVYTPDVHAKGAPAFNYSYVDQIYDGLLAEGVRPYVELSFMPQKLASQETPKSVWYIPNNSPPSSYEIWDDMIRQFVQHLVARYGIDEVSQWYFEVWNEPDWGFPKGVPWQETYLTLYDHTARAVKTVDKRLRVGGPATANANWVPEFIAYCHEHRIPVDFISSHIYGDGSVQDSLHTNDVLPRNRLVCMAAGNIQKEIASSSMPELPFIMSEFNATWKNIPEVLDTTYMGPWLADTIRQCDGLVDMMSFWTFSDVFEEEGVVRRPFYGGFGIIAEDNMPKPVFHAFALLHKLGDTRLHSDSESALITRRKDGTLVIALWNYAEPTANPNASDPAKTFELTLTGISGRAMVRVSRLDETHGNVLQAYNAMGQPSWPTRDQIAGLQAAARLPPPERMRLSNGHLRIEIPPRGLVLLEIH